MAPKHRYASHDGQCVVESSARGSSAATGSYRQPLTVSMLQEYAEAHRQQLLQSNPQELAAQQLPTFDLDHLDLPSLFPQVCMPLPVLAQLDSLDTAAGGESYCSEQLLLVSHDIA